MDFKTFCIIFLSIFVTSTHRILASARLPIESILGYCAEEDTFTKANEDVDKAVRKKYGRTPHFYTMECGGNYTVAPGLIVKQTKVPFKDAGEPEHCSFKIKAPAGFHVYVYHYSYKWVTYKSCVGDRNVAAGLTNFYDGKRDLHSLLYSAARYRDDIEILSTGRELLVDVVQHGKDCWGVIEDHRFPDPNRDYNCYSEITEYQKIMIKYAFVKTDENGNIIEYSRTTKP